MQVTDGNVKGSLQGDLVTIHISGTEHFQGLSRAAAGILLDTILTFVSTPASYLFVYKGSVIHSPNVAPLGRVLSVLLNR